MMISHRAIGCRETMTYIWKIGVRWLTNPTAGYIHDRPVCLEGIESVCEDEQRYDKLENLIIYNLAKS